MLSDLVLAREAALTGAQLALRYFARVKGLPRELKADGSVVTEADRAVEEAIRSVLASVRPTDAFLGEETGQTGQGRRRWIIDPIDGTALFVAGDDRWLILIALEEDGQVVVGVAVVPAQGKIWWAQRGGGAFVADIDGPAVARERRISVGKTPAGLPASRLGVVPLIDSLSPSDLDVIARLSTVVSSSPWAVHAALLVASGELDLAVQVRGEVWDFAATSLIVEEAGGCFSGAAGQTHPVFGPALFSSSETLHKDALGYLA
jgi:histidinol-phosphatase